MRKRVLREQRSQTHFEVISPGVAFRTRKNLRTVRTVGHPLLPHTCPIDYVVHIITRFTLDEAYPTDEASLPVLGGLGYIFAASENDVTTTLLMLRLGLRYVNSARISRISLKIPLACTKSSTVRCGTRF